MKIDLSKYVLHMSEYGYDWVWADDDLCMSELLCDKSVSIKRIYQKKSINTLRKFLNSKSRDWAVSQDCSLVWSGPFIAKTALEYVEDFIHWEHIPIDDIIVAQKLPKDKAKKVLNGIHRYYAPQVEKMEREARERRYKQYLELRKEFEGK